MPVRWPVLVVVALVALSVTVGGAFEAGRRHGRADAAIEARQDSLQHNAEQLRVATHAVDTAHRVTTAEVHKDSVVQQARAVARGRIRIASDSQVTVLSTTVDSAGAVVDAVGPKIEIPKEVVTVLRTDDATVAQDSVTMRAMLAEIHALYVNDSLHLERERLLEAQLAALSPPRCGRRCGFVAGVTATYAATHPAQIVSAVTWIVRLAVR